MTIFIILISVSILMPMLLALGFFSGVAYSAGVMCRKVEKTRNQIFEKDSKKDSKGRRLTPRYQHAVAVAAECWCDARSVNIKMDTTLGLIFAEKISEYIEALQWCSGSDDFGPNGKAWIGFERVCRPLMRADHKIDISKLSIVQYENLRDNAPELLGLKG